MKGSKDKPLFQINEKPEFIIHNSREYKAFVKHKSTSYDIEASYYYMMMLLIKGDDDVGW